MTRRRWVGFALLQADGSTACGNWIYSGVYTAAGNNSRRRDASDPTGMGTLLHIHDPWAPNVGKTVQKSYYALVNETPCFTYGIFTR